MANVPEATSFDAGIYQIETTDPVLGGPNGIANAQAKGLANRTAFLKQQIDQLNSGQLKPGWIASTDYVQGELQKLDAKQSVRAATVANITLSGAQTIDGVTLTVGDRVLVKDQTTAAQNGIYLVAAQSWTRATDADNGTKLSSGARVAVEEGAVNAGKVWYLATAGVIAVGSTALLFTDEHPLASESVAGVSKVSTQSQTNAGTDDETHVTPKKLLFGVSMLISNIGYIKLPSWLGGLTIQWGSVPAIPANGVQFITLPVSFSSAVFALLPGSGALAPGQPAFNGKIVSTSEVAFYNTSTSAATLVGSYLVIGK
ncbi:gp53-like domain-containing protein [Aeromonas veronii]|uniref:gp53-like domain-containing protein n=1 Tax=Aeromonas veronii TaxID=654 RepID=UPI00191D1D77|nr:hypothetical protein [Aeromonas veronii]MBL0492676.1 hypothetical protein [Aeromonas veronii]